MNDQRFMQASVEFEDNSEMFMRDCYRVYANRTDSAGVPATYAIGTFYNYEEAQAMASEINCEPVTDYPSACRCEDYPCCGHGR